MKAVEKQQATKSENPKQKISPVETFKKGLFDLFKKLPTIPNLLNNFTPLRSKRILATTFLGLALFTATGIESAFASNSQNGNQKNNSEITNPREYSEKEIALIKQEIAKRKAYDQISNMPFIPKNEKYNEQIIINEAVRKGITDPRQIAYILATAKHETDNFNTLYEYGKGRDKKYEGRYYGRGYVQITWFENYQKYEIIFKDITKNPDLVSQDVRIAAYIIVDGMSKGTFTGVKLGDYINKNKTDFRNARRIVNGTDKASLIQNHAKTYLQKIKNGEIEIKFEIPEEIKSLRKT